MQHVPRHARPKQKPIESYGIILFYLDRDNVGGPALKFLLYQRRDTYEYIDVLRGGWSTEKRLRELLSSLTPEEKARISRHSFRELWDDLWIKHGSQIHTDGFERAQTKFESIRPKLHEMLSEVINFQNSEPPWGFPKGKKNENETDTQCALRELGEETHVDLDALRLWKTRPYKEEYRGGNGKPYSSYYYIAECTSALPIEKISTDCIRTTAVSEEAADARWMGLEEACVKLTARRQTILRTVAHHIHRNYEELSPWHGGGVEQSETVSHPLGPVLPTAKSERTQ
jgi:8-oxo-dGTP pyrophosphatase MutT (NUDIX family)